MTAQDPGQPRRTSARPAPAAATGAAQPAVRRGPLAHRLLMPAVAVVAIFGTYGATSALGVWQSSGRTDVTSGALAPADLKGWMTVQQASDGLGIDIPTLLRLTGADAATVAAVTPATPLNELEDKVPDFTMSAFRDAVTKYREHRTMPAPSPSAVPTTPAAGSTTPHPTGTGSGSGSPSGTRTGTGAASGVTGTMTLKQVAEAYGIALPDLMARAKLPADVPTDVPLRDLKARVPGFEVTVVRDAVGAG
ncbi:MAG: hypothetical protein IPK37_06555 [Austwickia sp.]|nr:MAG: hypothetical protein IPK37_06555 [Austwickia sp.]